VGAGFAGVLSLSVLVAACYGASAAGPAPAADGGLDAVAEVGTGADAGDAGDAGLHLHYAVCPDAMAPTFPSIYGRMLATGGCGVGASYDCHSSTGALPVADGGTGSLLDFSLDAAAVYEELLGDGGGYPSTNVRGDAGGIVLRVAPGDASASLLYIKLALPTENDPRYGTAMPPTGLVCPSALDAVRAWIDDGAGPN
jgi:hypothetical protein